MGLVPDSIATKGREAERGEVSPTRLWGGARVSRKKTHVLFVVGGILFVNSGNKNGCSTWVWSVLCVLGLKVGGRIALVMEIRLRMRHGANDIALADRTGSSAGGKPWCAVQRSVYDAS